MRRLLIIVATTGAFWGGSLVAPGLMGRPALAFFAGLFAILFTLCMFILPRLSELSAIKGLEHQERKRLVRHLKEIRLRVWWVVGVCAAGAGLIFLLGAAQLVAHSLVKPLGVGFSVGMGIAYGLSLIGWYNDAHEFSDRIRLRAEKQEKRDELLKRIDDCKDLPTPPAISA